MSDPDDSDKKDKKPTIPLIGRVMGEPTREDVPADQFGSTKKAIDRLRQSGDRVEPRDLLGRLTGKSGKGKGGGGRGKGG